MTGWRFHTPPGWPVPPPGWQPGPGWQPDPTWPPAPPGWRWWTPEPPRLRWLWAVAGVPVLIGGLLFTAELVDATQGCGSVDPTDPRNYSTLHIVNDTHQVVVVDACRGAYCDADRTGRRLGPGESTDAEAACGVSGRDMTSWRIRSVTGDPRGYVAVDSPRSTEGLVYRVSAASANRRTPSRTGRAI